MLRLYCYPLPRTINGSLIITTKGYVVLLNKRKGVLVQVRTAFKIAFYILAHSLKEPKNEKRPAADGYHAKKRIVSAA